MGSGLSTAMDVRIGVYSLTVLYSCVKTTCLPLTAGGFSACSSCLSVSSISLLEGTLNLIVVVASYRSLGSTDLTLGMSTSLRFWFLISCKDSNELEVLCIDDWQLFLWLSILWGTVTMVFMNLSVLVLKVVSYPRSGRLAVSKVWLSRF